MKQRKIKKKFDVGMLVKITDTTTSDVYNNKTHKYENRVVKDENTVGIIIGKDGMEIYFQIYLQESMKTVWREYDEIAKV